MVLTYFYFFDNDPETPMSRTVLNSITFQVPLYVTRLQATKNVPSVMAVLIEVMAITINHHLLHINEFNSKCQRSNSLTVLICP